MNEAEVQKRASKVLHDLADGIADCDEIGNVMRDLLRLLRMKHRPTRRDGR